MPQPTVLIISHSFPPAAHAGVNRVHSFVRYLPQTGWKPVVMTVDEKYLPDLERDPGLLAHYDPQTVIERTRSLEPHGKLVNELRSTAFGVGPRNPIFDRWFKPALHTIRYQLLFPDEGILWLPHGVKAGLRLVKEHQVDLILATTPPHSAGIIASLISRISHRPLVLDVRDDWVGNPHFYKEHSWWSRNLARRLESRVIRTASRVLTVSAESTELFRQKYPHLPVDRFFLLPNGFNGADIHSARQTLPARSDSRLRLVYTGGLPARRNPIPFFQALVGLKAELPLETLLQVDFYGNARQEFIEASRSMGLEKIVHFHGYVSRLKSFQQILASDAGLVLSPQEDGSKTAIPGKIYEYLGAERFVFALCSTEAATRSLVEKLKIGTWAPNDEPENIKACLRMMLARFQEGKLQVHLTPEIYNSYERRAQTDKLAHLFSSLVQADR